MMKTRKIIIETEDQDNETDSDNSVMNDSEQETKDDDDDSNVEYDSSNEEEGDSTVNAGWADSIAKILKTNKPRGKKTVVLSKAKIITDSQKRKLKDIGFEVEAKDGQIKNESIEESDSVQPRRKQKKDIPTYRVKPNILEKDREKLLSKIATKGVVQLFNAVKKQQKDIDIKLKDAGSAEVKRDKVLKNIDKREFLNVLMGGTQSSSGNIKQPQNKTKPKQCENDTPTWSVLRDDFLMSAKMKDWDKKLEDDVDSKEEDVDI